jgi:benzodiazapine receptor
MVIPGQTFQFFDIFVCLAIFFIELLLASDNAAAMAIIVKRLPEHKKEKALYAGLVSAFLLRAIGVIFTAYLIHLFWAQIIGGLYLIYICFNFIMGSKAKSNHFSPTSYFKAVILVELVDLLFAIDSILGAFAVSSLFYPFDVLPSKLWVIYIGGVLGLYSIRLVTKRFIRVLNEHKQIELVAFLLIGWMGVKLITEGVISQDATPHLRHTLDIFFWISTIIIVILGVFLKKIRDLLEKCKKSKTALLSFFLLLSFIVVFGGSYFTNMTLKDWYPTLIKPGFNPPAWVFGPVWTTLYIMIAISGYLVAISKKRAKKNEAFLFYGLQYFFNFSWSLVFFGMKSPLIGLIDISILLVLIAVTIKLFYKLDRLASYLLIPYFLWTFYAAILNASIYALNY